MSKILGAPRRVRKRVPVHVSDCSYVSYLGATLFGGAVERPVCLCFSLRSVLIKIDNALCSRFGVRCVRVVRGRDNACCLACFYVYLVRHRINPRCNFRYRPHRYSSSNIKNV